MSIQKTVFFFILGMQLLCIGLRAYEPNPFVSERDWERLVPYLLPNDHPIKPKLDRIFRSGKRVTLSSQTLDEADFDTPQRRPYSQVVVSKHPKLKGYVIKLYTEDTPFNDAYELTRRAVGAEYVRNAVNRLGYQHLFKVPKKWLYPLPLDPPPPPGYYRKNFVLVVEDMHIYAKEKNHFFWKSIAVTPDVLQALYNVMQAEGLNDSMHVSNVPFTKDGKIAFVDTAIYHDWPVRLHILLRYIAPSMHGYWQDLMAQ